MSNILIQGQLSPVVSDKFIQIFDSIITMLKFVQFLDSNQHKKRKNSDSEDEGESESSNDIEVFQRFLGGNAGYSNFLNKHDN